MNRSILKKMLSITISAVMIMSVSGMALADDDSYKIEFKPGQGGEGSMDDITGIQYGDSVTLPHVLFTNEGNYFWGWCFLTDAIGDAYDGETLQFTNDFVASGGYRPMNYMHDGVLTLTAYWENIPNPNPPAPAPDSGSDTDTTPAPDPIPDPAPSEDEGPAPVILTEEQIRAMSVENFVDNMYIAIVGRTYDETGKAHWTQYLLDSGSATAVVRGFFGSQEFLGFELTDEEYVTVLYRVFCNSTPDAEGLANWTNALASENVTRDQLIDQFATEPAWASICAYYCVNV